MPIPGNGKLGRLQENMRASEIILSQDEIREIDGVLENITISQVFGGSHIK